jgi:hypothetical protein
MEYLGARYNTKEGLFEWLIGSLIWGYIIVNYTQLIYGKISEYLNFLSPFFNQWISYMVFGLVLLPLGIFITYVLTNLYKSFFKNGRIIK